jgi:peptidoglycan/LPS O-acetylase OafA/YrhL
VQKNRFWELEGLRGVAAIVVATYHYLLAFYALAFLGPNSGLLAGQHTHFEDNFYGSPIAVFLSGTFAVAIFFVLSGFVLSIGFFQTGKLDIIKKLAAKRYFRLMLPALASILIAFTLLSLHLAHNQTAATITQSGWLGGAWTFAPNIFEAIRNGLFDIFAVSGNGYNNALWTMTYEFAGSFLVFGFLALFSTSKYRSVFYAFLLIATFNTWFMGFVLGMILADLYARGTFRQKIRRRYLFIPALIIGLFFGGYPIFGTTNSVYRYILPQVLGINWVPVSLTLGATVLIAVVLSTTQVAKVFANKYVSKLGKYTFSLYLVHLSILYTLTTAIFLLLDQKLGFGYNRSALLSIIFSIPVICVATILFEKYIDSQSIRLSSYAGGVMLGITKTPRLNKYLKNLIKKFKYFSQKVSNNG